ncbi:hypothetical protein C8R47DRAFT_1194124 [Mycena vitilis]|nr:hypothetical protein C8R47DRAFT_1194124 [Mycena vitilis]
MAILAPPDWQYSPRDPAMDKGPAQSSSNPPPSQQRPTQLPPAQQQHHPQQYPFQQQPQGNWTPSLAAPPFYPGAFYQNGAPQPQASPQPYPTPPNPYFDPANAQLAQWAYQQMMFNAQQHGHVPQGDFFAPPGMHGQFNPFPSGTPPPRPNDAPQPQYAGFHPYRRPSRQQSSHSEANVPPPPQQDWQPRPPYSRPDASGSSSSVNSQGRPRTNSNNSQSRGSAHSHSPSPVPSTKGSPSSSPASATSPGPPPRMPHHRAGSSSSTHSAHSTSSTPTSPTSGSSASSSAAKLTRPSPLSQGTVTASTLPARSPLGSSSTLPSTRAERRISRDDSSLALSSLSLLATRAEAASSHTANANGKEPAVKGSGLKGRLRRALSFNASVALKEEVGADDDGTENGDGEGSDNDSDESIKASVVNPKAAPKAKTPALIASATRKPAPSASPLSPSPSALTASSSAGSPAGPAGTQVPMPKKKSRAASLFNSRMNVSTDNISLSSTVSSASVMIRKLGSMGRLARRNSLAGITGLFKDRKKKGEADDTDGEEVPEEDEAAAAAAAADGGKKKKGKEKEDKKKAKTKAKSGKGEASEASVSHATAELEAGDWSVPDAVGLSPAAKLARQHTLKSNAEAAAKAKEAAARQAAAAASANGNGNGVNGGGVPTWERNTQTRSPARRGAGVAVGEDGTHVLVEDSESEDEYGAAQTGYGQRPEPHQVQQQPPQHQQWDDEEDEDWGLLGGEEDDTIRVGDAYPQEEEGEYEDNGEHEPWATDLQRSAERARVPARGILKHAGTYDQASYLLDGQHPNPLRARSNSYNSPGQSELGPLARMPSPDPDHIDGLHRHGSHSSAHGGESSPSTPNANPKRSSIPSLPPLAFETGGSVFDSPQATPTAATYAAAAQATLTSTPSFTAAPAPTTGAHAIFNHPALNSSAPALTHFSSSGPSLVPRAVTVPAKKTLAFASNLSVYDTFSASMYDRRSEPATWSRLTPALAQRIKEELNSYKMEEMEVHAASRIHTQFFV